MLAAIAEVKDQQDCLEHRFGRTSNRCFRTTARGTKTRNRGLDGLWCERRRRRPNPPKVETGKV